jgi:nucleotide-binding universal stress UspA family protein
MKIQKLLFVTKFEELSFDALRSLATLRDAALNHVVLFNVIERDRVAMRRGKGYRKDEEIKLRETANIRFIDWAENLFEEGMEVGVYIVVGSLVPEVIKAVEKEQADLIVIGRSQKGALAQLYSGSDVTELLRRASVPVLVYKQISETALVLEKPFKRLLLATDWSAASERAVNYLKDLNAVVEEIHVIHVVDDKELTGDNSLTVQKTRKKTREKLDRICDIFENQGMRAEPHVYVGDPVKEIEKAARENQATMVVLGSSGKSSFVEKWIGSTPRKIAEDTIYPTLIIPPEKKES